MKVKYVISIINRYGELELPDEIPEDVVNKKVKEEVDSLISIVWWEDRNPEKA